MSTDSIRYELLGPVRAVRGSTPVELGPPRQRAVLALLLVEPGHAMPSDRMIDALWADQPPPAPMASLQAYVSNLRRVLEPDRPARRVARVLQTIGGGYRLELDPDDLDTERFGTAVAAAAAIGERDPRRVRELLDDALALWSGPALADFRYEEFAQREIERLEEQQVHALELRIGAALALGRSADLIPEIEALVREHPRRERLRAHQMLALYRAGRQTEALDVYRDFAGELREELGLDPGRDLRDLQLAILDHDPVLAPPPIVPTPPRRAAARAAPIVVGRAAEQRQFHTTLRRARSGRGAVVLVEGEAGVGKTRLLEHFHHESRQFGAITAFARCVEVGGTPPFWPWMQLIRQLGPDAVAAAAGSAQDALAPLLPHAPGSERSTTTGAPLYRIAEGVIVALQTFAESAPIVLLIDDLYSADPDSLSLLALLAAELDQLPVVIVASHRGLGPTNSGALATTVTQLRRLDWVDNVRIGGFAATEVADLIAALTGARVDDSLVAAVHARTNGNAFFAIELTKLLQSEARLNATAALTAVPGPVRDIVGRRLEQLSPACVRLLRVGAVVGREFEPAGLADVVDMDIDTMLGALDEATRAGLLREAERAGVYRFAHVIVVDVVVHGLGSVRRAQLHQQVANGIEGRGLDSAEAWVDIAHHRTEAIAVGGVAAAVTAMAIAGRRAMEADALGLAEELFERRRALVAEIPPSPSRDALEVDALLDLVRVWTWTEGYHSARLGEATERVWDLAGLRHGAVELDASRPITAEHPVLSVLQARSSYDLVRGDIAAARSVTDLYMELADRSADPMVEFGANFVAVAVWVHAGNIADAVAAAQRGAAALAVLDPGSDNGIMLPLGQQSARVAHHSFAGWAYYLAGDRARAELELRTSRQHCERIGHRFTFGFAAAVEGLVAVMDGSPERVSETVAWGRASLDDGVFGLMDGWHIVLTTWADGMTTNDPVAAATQIRQRIAALRRDGAVVVHSLYWAMIATLEQRAGRSTEVLTAAEQGIAHVEQSGERFWYPELERIAAMALAELGRPDDARAAQRRAVAAARASGIRPLMDRLSTRSAH